jgi:ABC-2 type transport system permease protein
MTSQPSPVQKSQPPQSGPKPLHSLRITLANIVAIYRRELQSYFASPLAYGVAGIFWLLTGYFFTALLFGPQGVIQQAQQMDLVSQSTGSPVPPVDVPYQLLQFFLNVLGSVSLFILPILSMGLYTEERKRGTLELLATSPLTNWSIALGKLLAVVTFFITMVLPLLGYELMVFSTTNPPLNLTVLLFGHGALILLAAALLSLGMFISSLTGSIILSALGTFALTLFLWVIDLAANSIPGPLGKGIGHLSMLQNYTTLSRGILDTGSLVLFASYIVLGVFLTAQSIEAFRYQRN